ncbi:MAG: hypothetical protein A3C61_01965 [Candidatus Yanofskybacteria bacterium RIFCSPHIGHO2_02_FULL_39_10]|uniref:Uncharacterized protein n=1 Tax=Candidatus Yanofskybacteria bacterium RIFCSPHIGHO2_02_FULL_39_10 TaxID=1802674 RepID=A0A1F8F7D4_9BACT|nr:MAG: hypothetical protein A3C61_01965 [Candidatus Yanofskybacteria bacterium RIFCSPHIGHO2_02_FULL_39_10]
MKQVQLPINKDGVLDIKSPIFTPRPGWGGKLKKWLSNYFESRILPALAFSALTIGIYLVLK